MMPHASCCHKFICMQVNGFLLLYNNIPLLHLTLPYALRCLFCPHSLYNYIQALWEIHLQGNYQNPDVNAAFPALPYSLSLSVLGSILRIFCMSGRHLLVKYEIYSSPSFIVGLRFHAHPRYVKNRKVGIQ